MFFRSGTIQSRLASSKNFGHFFFCLFVKSVLLVSLEYTMNDFQEILRELPKRNIVLVCGDLNFPNTNWASWTTFDEEEAELIELFKSRLLKQSINFPTCNSNTLDVFFYQNCTVFSENDQKFDKTFNCSDHLAIKTSVDFRFTEYNPVREKYKSYGSGDYKSMIEEMEGTPFTPVCFTNIDNMYAEYIDYLDWLSDLHVPTRTSHRQTLPPWIQPSTSHELKKLETQKRLLSTRPTSYRKSYVCQLENMVTELCEQDRIDYQNKLLGSRSTHRIFKHLKHLNKSAIIPLVVELNGRSAETDQQKAELFNEFFNSVFAPKTHFSKSELNYQTSSLSNFSISVKTISNFISDLDISKSRGPNGKPPVIYKYTNREMSKTLNVLFKNIKRLRKMPSSWKTAAVSPIYKKDDRKLVENYRGISLLDIDEKIFEKCMYEPLYKHFASYLSRHQHGFVRGRSVYSNMLRFLKDIHEALDRNTDDYIVAFYADFSKAFDRVPHQHLLNKLCSIEVGGCLLDLLYDYLDNRKQYVRIGNHCSNLLDVTSGVPQGSLLGPLLYCIFINDLPDALRFSQPYIFADDLKLLYTGQNQLDAQSDLSSIEKWVELNQMKLALEKCGMLTLKGSDGNLSLYKQKLEKVNVIKDLGVFIKNDLSWTCHINERLKKSNKVLYLLRRNIAYSVNTFVKLGLYKSIVLPILLYGFHCVKVSRTDLLTLEQFQRKVVKWICGDSTRSYVEKLRLLNLLPLPIFLQLNDLLFLTKICPDEDNELKSILPHNLSKAENSMRRKEIFSLKKTRTEKRRSEFIFQTCRLANKIDDKIKFHEAKNLKARLIKLMWEFVEKKFSSSNVCTWQLCCDCQKCRNLWTIF